MTSQTKHAIPSWAFLIVVLLYLSLLFLLQVFSNSNADFSTLAGDKSINLLKWLQLLASVFTFVLPVFVLALVIRQERLKFFNLHRHINYIQATNVVILFVVTIPLVSVSAILNQYIMDLPFLADFKLASLAKEKALDDLIQSFFADKSIGGLITNLIVVALSAAVTEEIFFRGTLQRLFHENIKSIHITVWLTAIIFSAFHMQFSGFLPRTILGALLGYVYIYTGNLWLPIIGHFINNGLAVVGNHFNIEQLNEVEKNVKPNNMLYIISIVSIGIIIYLLVKIRNNESLKLSSNIFGRAKAEGDS
jgi:uncharacterized protein